MTREKIIGLQVVDTRGIIVGTIKDFSFSVGKNEISLVVSSSSGSEIIVPWKDVQGAGDVVLLSKPVQELVQRSQDRPTVPKIKEGVGVTKCARCGASAPSVAKFCPKCGTSMKRTGTQQTS